MIISISGTPGSGKTTIAKFLSKALHFRLCMVGEMLRKIAEERGISIVELDKLAVSDRTIDEEIDKIHLKLKDEDNLVIDSRIAFKFFPDSLKLFLLCRPEISAKRIFKEKRSTEKVKDGLNQILEEITERNRLDILRYKKYYKVSLDDLSNYDVVIDTSDLDIPTTKKLVLDAIKKLL